MVKKIFIIAALFVILTSPASAQLQNTQSAPTTTNTQRPATLRAPSDSASQSPIAETMQMETQVMQDNSQGRLQNFRARIQQIQDTRKRGIVENIANKVTTANARITGKMSQALDKLSTILERVEARAEALAANGQNTTALLSTIVEAENAIEEANIVVNEQKEKQYTAEITNDLTLRNTIGTMVSEFRTDISVAHEAVVNAKQAVAQAIAQAAQLQGASNDASESATIN